MEKCKESPCSQFAEGVAMVTAKFVRKENAMPASWTVPVSFKPKLVSISIAPERYTHDLVKDSGKFGLCLLAEDQKELAEYAGSCSGRDADKFEKIPKFYGKLEIPLVEGAAACLECKVVDAAEEGDHTVFTGEVVNLFATKKKPLVLFRGDYYELGKRLGSY